MQLFWVFLGGGLGSLCRYGIARWLSRYAFAFPWATLAANVLACVVLGFLIGLDVQNKTSTSARLLIMTGFCGGFSTFSTFTAETFQLFEIGHTWQAFSNIFGSVLICLAAVFLGLKLATILL